LYFYISPPDVDKAVLHKLDEKFTDPSSEANLMERIIQYIEFFKFTKYPNSVCWLMEICSLLTTKFKSKTYYNDQRMKAKLQLIMTILLKSSAEII
jgi:hypothetical protein